MPLAQSIWRLLWRMANTIAQEVEKAAVLLQLLRRLESADDNGYAQCVTCHVYQEYKLMEGGHFISRGKLATKLDERNIHPQCLYCNHFGGDFVKIKYRQFMDHQYGAEFVTDLEQESRGIKKYTRPEVQGLAKDFRSRIRVEQQRVGG